MKMLRPKENICSRHLVCASKQILQVDSVKILFGRPQYILVLGVESQVAEDFAESVADDDARGDSSAIKVFAGSGAELG